MPGKTKVKKEKRARRKQPRPLPGFDAPTSAAIRYLAKIGGFSLAELVDTIRQTEQEQENRRVNAMLRATWRCE